MGYQVTIKLPTYPKLRRGTLCELCVGLSPTVGTTLNKQAKGMIKTTLISIAAGQLLSRMNPKHKQKMVDVAKVGVAKVNGAANNFLDGLTEQHEQRVNEMMENGEIYYKNGKFYYTDTNEPFMKVKS